eukprot:CAMPEP_0185252034 /NCGR_PEP_ID=MMETSP1359-20130426/1273_1 /TAXON_ID=552665 /ORGANISM="Bigelowiella longifila, Strain CCMP242" /LENGTH=253 /DNA_ID=CAMNT_0027834115 /DNA_START=54 /DNA_END=815 /DNA_ORIENTATION=-
MDTELWGTGGLMPRVSQADLLRMVIRNTSWGMKKEDGDSDSAAAEISKDLTAQSSEHEGLEGLREDRIREIITLGFKEGKDINDGFFVRRFLAEQAKLHRCTSVATTDEIVRVEGTSTVLMDETTNSPQQPPVFCYRISIENVGDNAFTLLGRHWEIYDSGEEKIIAEVPYGSRGVVGLSPSLEPEERFVYYSGCSLHSSSGGWIRGSFEMVLFDENMETESISDAISIFGATVSPIPLEVEIEATNEEISEQ